MKIFLGILICWLVCGIIGFCLLCLAYKNWGKMEAKDYKLALKISFFFPIHSVLIGIWAAKDKWDYEHCKDGGC